MRRIVQQYRDAARWGGAEIRGDDIREAVAVDIRHDEVSRAGLRGIGHRGQKRTGMRRVLQNHRHARRSCAVRTRAEIRSDQVSNAVAIHVRNPQRNRLRAGRNGDGREKRTRCGRVLIEHDDRAVIAIAVGSACSDVHLPVAVDVPHCDTRCRIRCGQRYRGEEVPRIRRILRQDQNASARTVVRDDQVQLAIAIHIGELHIVG